MRRALTVVLLGLWLGIGSARAVSDPAEMLPNPAEEARAEAIGQQLRCLVCQNESIEASDADLARDIRALIRQQVAAGRTNPQIIAAMVQRYGDFILLRPPFDALTALLWATPVLALLLGAAAVLLGLRRRRGEGPPAPLSPAERARLEQLLRP
ncbi:cytochrome c-type biogenesis protein [Acidisoma sp. 7E03]